MFPRKSKAEQALRRYPKVGDQFVDRSGLYWTVKKILPGYSGLGGVRAATDGGRRELNWCVPVTIRDHSAAEQDGECPGMGQALTIDRWIKLTPPQPPDDEPTPFWRIEDDDDRLHSSVPETPPLA